MSRRFIQLLIVVVTITLIGLIYIQMLWIRNATSIKEDHFDQLVRQALDQVVHRLELNETSYFGAQLDLDPGLSLPPQLRNENRYFSGKNQFREDKNRMKYDISLDFSLTGTHLSTRFYQSDSLVYSHQEWTPMEYNPQSKADPLSYALNNFQSQLRSKIAEQEARLMKGSSVQGGQKQNEIRHFPGFFAHRNPLKHTFLPKRLPGLQSPGVDAYGVQSTKQSRSSIVRPQ